MTAYDMGSFNYVYAIYFIVIPDITVNHCWNFTYYMCVAVPVKDMVFSKHRWKERTKFLLAYISAHYKHSAASHWALKKLSNEKNNLVSCNNSKPKEYPSKRMFTHTQKKLFTHLESLLFYLYLRSVISMTCAFFFFFCYTAPVMWGECKSTGNGLDPSKHHLWHWHHAQGLIIKAFKAYKP